MIENNDLKGLLSGVIENTEGLEKQLQMNFAKKLHDRSEEVEPEPGPLGVAIRNEEGQLLARFLYKEPDYVDFMTEKETLFLLSAGLDSVISMMGLSEEQVNDYLSFLKNLLLPKFKNGAIIYFHGASRAFNISYDGLKWEAIQLVKFVDIEKIINKILNPAGEEEEEKDEI